ncbi:MAG: MBL fold metallo-hydrolase [Rhodospirillaceae bacterium]
MTRISGAAPNASIISIRWVGKRRVGKHEIAQQGIVFMKQTLSTLSIATLLLAAPAMAAEQGPSIEELLKPAPNPAWNEFAVAGYDTTKIADGVYVFRYTGTRSLFMITDDGVIVTDPISPAIAKIFREEVAKITDQPVKYVVYSHEHWDHVPGAQIFKDEGAQIVAHENCARHFYDLPNPDIVMPDITFSDDYTLELGGRKLELLYFGPNHGDCMVVMRPDPGDYLYIVDLVTPGGAPLGFMPDYAPHHYVRTLKEIEAIDYKAIIGGHGAMLSHPSAVTERRQYLEALMKATREAMASGANPFELHKVIRVPEFAHLRGYESRIEDNARRMLAFYGIGW